MLVILSPSKTVNFKRPKHLVEVSRPQLLDKSSALATRLNSLSTALPQVLNVSDKLAEENRKRFSEWTDNPETIQPAAWVYRGETYAGLSINELDPEMLSFAQNHILIVSGLYGLLRPQDNIMPYRLEMSTKLSGPWGNNLYDFWGTTLADHISAQNPKLILNCASAEYSKAIIKHLPTTIPIVTPKFLHEGKSKMAFAKFSRGLMARWVAETRPSTRDELKKFNYERYRYNENLSEPNKPVFIVPRGFSLKGRWTKL